MGAFERSKEAVILFGCRAIGSIFNKEQLKELRDMVDQVLAPMESYHETKEVLMGSYRQLYFGPYMRIWMPEVVASIPSQTCTNESCEKHGEHMRHKFCPYCSSPVDNIKIEKPSHLNLHEFMEEELGDQDMFRAVYPDNVDYIIAVPNRPSTQGGTHFEDNPRTEVLILSGNLEQHMTDFDKLDWEKLEAALMAKDIKYEKLTGVLQWFS